MGSAATTKLLGAGAIGSAIAASICCFGPLAFALGGLGGGALLLKLGPYRPYSLAAATLLLGAAFYATYRNRPCEEDAPGSSCAKPSSRRSQRIVLWIVAAAVVSVAAFPYYAGYLF